jgi:hypothetical protein
VPRLGGFYPEATEETGRPAMAWARDQERLRLDWTLRVARAEGILAVPFDRRGVAGPILRAYTTIRGS